MKSKSQTAKNIVYPDVTPVPPETISHTDEGGHTDELSIFPDADNPMTAPASPVEVAGVEKATPRTRRKKNQKPPASSAINNMSLPGRQVPFSIEAEQGVLGCILLDPINNLSLFASKLKAKISLKIFSMTFAIKR